jgi:hypothetical protein
MFLLALAQRLFHTLDAPRARWGRIAGRIALIAWFISAVGLSLSLLSKHLVPFRGPARSAALGRLFALRPPAASDRWLAVHVLYGECRCSLRIRDRLANTRRPAGWAEAVLWVGAMPEGPDLTRHGFVVRRVTPREAGQYGILATPVLVAFDPRGALTYVGGYADRKQGSDTQDLRVMAAVRRGDAVEALPVYGCALSAARGGPSLLPGI